MENKSLTEYKAELPEQFSDAQLAYLQAETPKAFIKFKPGKGGSGDFPYVEVGYVQLLLNTIFGSAGWDWQYSLVKELSFPNTDQIVVQGELTVRIMDKATGEIKATIKKSASGGGEVKILRNTGKPMDLADDMKSASADALKKASSYLGIAQDIYAPKVFAVVKQIRAKSGRKPVSEPIVDSNTELEIENMPEEAQVDEKTVRAGLLRTIFARANEIHKAKLDTSWIGKSDEERKEQIKMALATNGLTIKSFAEASIEDLRKAVDMLKGA